VIALRYKYESVFAPYIEGLIKQKKADGFIYDAEAYLLKRFDSFCIANGYDEAIITRDIAMRWAIQRETEGINYRNGRVSSFRQLCLYMNSLGINSYIPRHMASEAVTAPHILSEDELNSLFTAIDTYTPRHSVWGRFSMGYQVLIRLYYCCGLRLSEGCKLKKEDVDLKKGTLTIRQSKGQKDRLVFMADDLAGLCRKYYQKISELLPNSIWLFPGLNPNKHLNQACVTQKFKRFWEMTPYADNCDKAPTPHALRHTFVVDRMNRWMAEGVPLDVMLPYLSIYLGHTNIEGTLYYYHQVMNAFEAVRQKDKISGRVIPEVMPYEE